MNIEIIIKKENEDKDENNKMKGSRTRRLRCTQRITHSCNYAPSGAIAAARGKTPVNVSFYRPALLDTLNTAIKYVYYTECDQVN